ncbi:hypothetical protein GCM10023334_020110 [Nonomuraea thailandensis]
MEGGGHDMSAQPIEGWLVAHPPPSHTLLFPLAKAAGYTIDDWHGLFPDVIAVAEAVSPGVGNRKRDDEIKPPKYAPAGIPPSFVSRSRVMGLRGLKCSTCVTGATSSRQRPKRAKRSP